MIVENIHFIVSAVFITSTFIVIYYGYNVTKEVKKNEVSLETMKSQICDIKGRIKKDEEIISEIVSMVPKIQNRTV